MSLRTGPIPLWYARRKEMADSALIAACADNEPAALEELFHRYGERVKRILSRVGRIQRDELDDATLTVFRDIWRAAPRFGGDAPTTWMLRIAIDVSHRALRTMRRTEMTDAGTAYAEEHARSGDSESPPSGSREQLRDGFEGLPQQLREAFTLCDLEDLHANEVARILKVDERTVWRRVDSARKRLRMCVDGGTTRTTYRNWLSLFRRCPADWVLTRAGSTGADLTVALHLEWCVRCRHTFNLQDDIANRAAAVFASTESMNDSVEEAIAARLLSGLTETFGKDRKNLADPSS